MFFAYIIHWPQISLIDKKALYSIVFFPNFQFLYVHKKVIICNTLYVV